MQSKEDEYSYDRLVAGDIDALYGLPRPSPSDLYLRKVHEMERNTQRNVMRLGELQMDALVQKSEPSPWRLANTEPEPERPYRFEWFGAPWDSPLCKMPGARRHELPPGECFACGSVFRQGDQGLWLSDASRSTPFHRRCFFAWVKERRLPLDLGRVAAAIAQQRDVRASLAAQHDRTASRAHEEALAAGPELGDAWENPCWEEP